MSRPESPLAVRLLRTVLAWAWALLSLLLFVPLSLLARPFDPRQRVHDLCSILWARGVLLLAGARLRVTGQESVSRAERYVIVANHQSYLDGMVMVAAMQPLTPVRMVAKRAAFKIPLLGWAMRAFGHMAVDHRSLRGSVEGLQQARSTVEAMQSIVFFPEGTRSLDGKLLPFHNAAFHIAARAGARVLPVTIRGSHEIMPKRRLLVTRPGEVQVVIHPPVALEGQGQDQVRQGSDRVRAVIESVLAGE